MTPPTVTIPAAELRWLLDSFPLIGLSDEGAATYWRLRAEADAALAEHDADEEDAP